MTFLSAILTGLSSIPKAKRLWGFLYLILLFLALALALPIDNLLSMAFGHSLDLNRHLGEFDYTVFADLMNNHGNGVSMLLYHAKWIILIYLIVAVFLSAGIVPHFLRKKDRFHFSAFVKDAGHYFWRFLRLSIYCLFFYAIVFGLSFVLFQTILGGLSPFEIENDTRITPAFYCATGLALLLGILVNSIQNLAKYEIADQDPQFIHASILHAAKTVFRNLLTFILFNAVLLILWYLWYLLNKWTQQAFNPDGRVGIYLMLFFGQLFIFLRVALQLIKYSGMNYLHRHYKS